MVTFIENTSQIQYCVPLPGFDYNKYPLVLTRESNHIVLVNLQTKKIRKVIEIK